MSANNLDRKMEKLEKLGATVIDLTKRVLGIDKSLDRLNIID